MALLLARTILHDWDLGEERANILIEDGHRNSAQLVQQLMLLTKRNEFLLVNEVGAASKRDNPILQAADMLAYGDWASMTGLQSDIYDALHGYRGTYQAFPFECTQELIETAPRGIDAVKEDRRQFWLTQRKNTL